MSSETEVKVYSVDFTASDQSEDAVTIQTSDGGAFLVHKSVLTTISSVFRNLVQDSTDDRQPIKLTESSLTWMLIFRVVHPDVQTEEVNHDLSDVKRALEATDKYDMGVIRVLMLDTVLARDFMTSMDTRRQVLEILGSYKSSTSKYMSKLVEWEDKFGSSFNVSVIENAKLRLRAAAERATSCEKVKALAQSYPPGDLPHEHRKNQYGIPLSTADSSWYDIVYDMDELHTQNTDWTPSAVIQVALGNYYKSPNLCATCHTSIVTNFDKLKALVKELKLESA